MKTFLAALLWLWCGLVCAQTADELLTSGKNPENVTTFGMGYDLKMYSPLDQINKSSVKRLVPVWNFSLSNDVGEHSQPTIYNGVMYVVNGNWTFAIDVATGKQIWRTPVQYDRAALRVATGGGLLFTGLATGEFIALDQDNGNKLWQFKTGSSINAPPITYTHKGQQYVTVLSGRGGSNPNRFAGPAVPAGGSVWTFALMPN